MAEPPPFPTPVSQQPPPPPGAYPYPPRSSGKAVASLVVSIASLLFGWICCLLGIPGSIVAIVLGRQARGEIRASAGAITGDGMATAGEVIGYVGVVISLFLVVVFAGLILLGNSTKDVFCNISEGLLATP